MVSPLRQRLGVSEPWILNPLNSFHDVIGKFDTDLVSELETNEQALEYLVLDERAKELVLTLAQGHQANSSFVDDFIAGKGKSCERSRV